jgi:hypothetical protein
MIYVNRFTEETMNYKQWKPRAPRRHEGYWGPIVKSQRLSGLSKKKFCEQKGVSYASFNHWFSRLKEGSEELQELEEIGSFVPAVLTRDLDCPKDLSQPHEGLGFLAGFVTNHGNCHKARTSGGDRHCLPLQNQMNGERAYPTEPALPGPSQSGSPCLRDLGIRFDHGVKGNACTIVVPQGFDELTLHRLLKVVGCQDV